MGESDALSATHKLVAIALAASLVSALFVWPDKPSRAAPNTGAAPVSTFLSGPGRAIDGDTLDINGIHIRLEGIDAPELGQSCARPLFGSWNCGTSAANTLAKLVKGREVRCESRGTDKYGRVLGYCQAGGDDINKRMVREGHAWAFVKYSQTYVEDEAKARGEKRGIWTTENEPAWIFREKRWAGSQNLAPNGCAIKGNVTKNGRIYHMPWSPWYAKIKLDPASGERWFCTESEATAAGWRPVQSH